MKHNARQQQFINHDLEDGDLAVIGLPGTGKSTTCKSFAKAKNEKLLYLTYSKRACSDFRRNHQVQGLLNIQTIRTFHSIAGSISTNFGANASKNIKTAVVGIVHYLNNNPKVDLRDLQVLKNIKYIIVDEFQDLSKINHDFLCLLKARLGGIPVIAVGDPNQSIYAFQGGSAKFLLEHSPNRVIQLIENYRSTEQIVNFVNCITPFDTEPMVSSSAATGPKPIFIQDDYAGLSKFVLDKIKATPLNERGEIAIVGPVRKCMNDSVGLSLFFNLLDKEKIKYKRHYRLEGESGTDDDKQLDVAPDAVNLITGHGSKGLEWKTVFLLNFHFDLQNRRPCEQSYREHLNLIYVMASRAKCELYCLASSEKGNVFQLHPAILEAIPDTYELVNCKLPCKPKFRENIPNWNFPVCDALRRLQPAQIFTLERMLNIKQDEDTLLDAPTPTPPKDDYNCLRGIMAEKIFNYTWRNKHNKLKDWVDSQRYLLENHIVIPENLGFAYKSFKSDFGTLLKFDDVLKAKEEGMRKNTLTLYKYVLTVCGGHKSGESRFLILDSPLVDENTDKPLEALDKINEDYFESLWTLNLWYYQANNQCRCILTYDWTETKNYLKEFEESIQTIADSYTSEASLQVDNRHPNLNIHGVADIVDSDGTITELKFCKQLDIMAVLQLLLYYNNLNPSWKQPLKLKIINLFDSVETTYTINPELTPWKFMRTLCDALNAKMRNLEFFYDLETTGVDPYSCDIVERHIEEKTHGWVVSKGLIYNENSPMSPGAVQVTGITDELKEKGDVGLRKLKTEMNQLFSVCQYPTCLAHNGNQFDHVIMERLVVFPKDPKLYIKKDSRWEIRLAVGKTDTKDCKLGTLYESIVGKPPVNSHRSESDVRLLLEIYHTLESKTEQLQTPS